MIDRWSEKVTIDHNDASSPSPLLVLIRRGHHIINFRWGHYHLFEYMRLVSAYSFDTTSSKVWNPHAKHNMD